MPRALRLGPLSRRNSRNVAQDNFVSCPITSSDQWDSQRSPSIYLLKAVSEERNLIDRIPWAWADLKAPRKGSLWVANFLYSDSGGGDGNYYGRFCVTTAGHAKLYTNNSKQQFRIQKSHQ
jgi:hypothetical protein